MTDIQLSQLQDLDNHQRIVDAFKEAVGHMPGSRRQKQPCIDALKPFELAGWVPRLFYDLMLDSGFNGLEIAGSDDVRYIPPSTDLSEAGGAICDLLTAYVESVEAL